MKELIIRLSDSEYEIIKKDAEKFRSKGMVVPYLYKVIESGTPLPKGHGRILDEKDILDIENNDGGWYDLVDMPDYIAGVKAIIEADKKESEDKGGVDENGKV